MARIEKTVFISYRRKDVSWALTVYQDLTHQGYDVFFDYTNILGGDFEQIILSNIKARAHFVLILTPTALDRCSEPGDWLRREIELAIDEKRNIIPLFFDGFNFGSVSGKLTGKLQKLSSYNGMNVHQDYFLEAMERLRNKFLNVPLNAVLHPVSAEVQEVVLEEQRAANKAAEAKAKAKARREAVDARQRKQKEFIDRISKLILLNVRKLAISGIILVVLLLALFGGNYILNNLPAVEMPGFAYSVTVGPLTFTPTKTYTPSPTTIASAPTLGVGSIITSEKDGMVLVYVPEGKFIMGSGDGALDEKPIHTVNLDAFWIDQTEVTNEMYTKCVADNGACKEPTNASSYTHSSYYGNSEFGNYPVLYVNWSMARAYCSWAGRRLPTEAEWEKAARGTDARSYPWGNDSPDGNLLNYNGNVGDTTEVGAYPGGASIYGAYDMAGNVWEWVNDWYESNYYANSPESNPLGPNLLDGGFRVLRGGTWDLSDFHVRSANRDRDDPTLTLSSIGFRCASSP